MRTRRQDESARQSTSSTELTETTRTSQKPPFVTQSFFYTWSVANLVRGKRDGTRKHPLATGLIALMLNDARETCSRVPNYKTLSVKDKISLGSIAGHQRKAALQKKPKEKYVASGMAKELVSGVYLTAAAQVRYDRLMKKLITPAQEKAKKKKRAEQRKLATAQRTASRKAKLAEREDTPDFGSPSPMPVEASSLQPSEGNSSTSRQSKDGSAISMGEEPDEADNASTVAAASVTEEPLRRSGRLRKPSARVQ